MLDIDLSHYTQLSSILGFSHPASGSNLAQVFTPPGFWVSYATFAETRLEIMDNQTFVLVYIIKFKEQIINFKEAVSYHNLVSKKFSVLHFGQFDSFHTWQLAL